MMFGQVVTLRKRTPVPLGEPVLQLHDLTVSDWRLEVKNLNLTVKAGEVVGLAGLEGSGQRPSTASCFRPPAPIAGRVNICAKDLTGQPYVNFLKRRSGAHASGPAGRRPDRRHDITEHVALAKRSHEFLVNWHQAEISAAQRIKDYNIKGTAIKRTWRISRWQPAADPAGFPFAPAQVAI